MRRFLAILIAKLCFTLVKLFKLGAGETWPGHLALKIYPKIASSYRDNFAKVILISGTNGKTTTAKLITSAIESAGYSVIYNPSGANLLNGVTSSLIRSFPLFGKRSDNSVGIFEVDEGALPAVCERLRPDLVLLLNLFRDQLDRYAELEMTAKKWREALNKLPKESIVVLNADDPLVAALGSDLRESARYFGIDGVGYVETLHPSTGSGQVVTPLHGVLPVSDDLGDSHRCPSCGADLKYKKRFYSHIGDWYCPKCNKKRPALEFAGAVKKGELSISQRGKLELENLKTPVEGFYNYYNVLAAFSACSFFGISNDVFRKNLNHFSPAFGRQEEFLVEGKKVKLLLSKNPTGFNENLKILLVAATFNVADSLGKGETKSHNYKNNGIGRRKPLALFVLNDGVADGRDISWVWDINSELLASVCDHCQVLVAGRRFEDLALRLKYSLPQASDLKPQASSLLEEALKIGVKQTPKNGIFYILPTYTAMLETRKILIGKKIL